MPEAPNTRRIEFVETLGKGGFGAVYLANLHGQSGFVQRVAIKVLTATMNEVDDIAARQRDEARLLAQLNHDNIVKVMDLIEIQGRPAVIMEHVEGVDVQALVNAGPLPPRAALQIISAVASALHAAHTRPSPQTGRPLGVIHRDIKPANILVTMQGGVKVLDFGVARADFDREGETQSVMFGTARFMAPEMWLEGMITDKVDTYALGVCLAEMLAGATLRRAPLAREHHEAHLNSVLDALFGEGKPCGINTDLAELLRAMLSFTLIDRPNALAVQGASLALIDEMGGENLGRLARRMVPPLMATQREKMRSVPILTSAAVPLVGLVSEGHSDTFASALEPTGGEHTTSFTLLLSSVAVLVLALVVAVGALFLRTDPLPAAPLPAAPLPAEASATPAPAPVAMPAPPPTVAPPSKPNTTAAPTPQPVATPAVVPTQSISFISIPMQAEVKVDGRPLGPAPFEAELTRGSHTVTMSLGGTVLATSLSVNRRGADTIRCDFQENRCTTEYSSH